MNICWWMRIRTTFCRYGVAWIHRCKWPKYPRYKCKHHRKGFHYRTCGDHVFILWDWSLEGPKLHECPGRSNGNYLSPAVAAFIGALTAGLLASLLKNKVGYPRISVTVPSIVIMVPGLYLYHGFYNLGIMSLSLSASWFAAALLIIAALPLGLIFARILTDKAFRYCTWLDSCL